MSTLTDRYISEVVRHLPEKQRDDISAEIAATIDDMVAAELDAGTAGSPDTESAELAVLTRLGDPAALARRYSGARRYLVGPEVYPVWAQVLRWLLPVVGIIAALTGGIVFVSTTAEPDIGGLIGQLVRSVLTALLGVFAAWTIVIVIVERMTPEGEHSPLALAPAWDPADLDGSPGGTTTRVDAIVSLGMLALLATVPFVPSTFLYIGHLNGGETLVNPDISTGWLAGYLLFVGALALVQVWRLVRPVRSRGRVAVKAVTDLLFGVFLTVLVLSQDLVIHPDLVAAHDGEAPTTVIRWALLAAIWCVVIWSQVENLRAYRRTTAPLD